MSEEETPEQKRIREKKEERETRVWEDLGQTLREMAEEEPEW